MKPNTPLQTRWPSTYLCSITMYSFMLNWVSEVGCYSEHLIPAVIVLLLCLHVSCLSIVWESRYKFMLAESQTRQKGTMKARLHQASASMLPQLCDDASNSVLMENIGVAPEYGCNPFLRDSIVFNKKRIASIITELSDVWLNEPWSCGTVQGIGTIQTTVLNVALWKVVRNFLLLCVCDKQQAWVFSLKVSKSPPPWEMRFGTVLTLIVTLQIS